MTNSVWVSQHYESSGSSLSFNLPKKNQSDSQPRITGKKNHNKMREKIIKNINLYSKIPRLRSLSGNLYDLQAFSVTVNVLYNGSRDDLN